MSNPAEGYEAYMVPTLFAPWATKLVALADPRPEERVLDVGCGTGVVARQVARRLGPNGSITAIDLSPNMLAIARDRAAKENATIAWHEGSAERLPFPEHSFHVVLCQFALMFFSDRASALAEMRRVLMERGRTLVAVWQGLDRHPFYRTLHGVIERRAGVSALEDIFSLGSAEELRGLLKGAGFRRVEVEPASMTARFPEPGAFLAGEIEVDTAAIPSMQQLDVDERKEIVASISVDMDRPLAEVTQGDHVVIPFHAHIATAWA
jgi:ubiquinone/menaquinone biosynthesis C-methylase UbiE